MNQNPADPVSIFVALAAMAGIQMSTDVSAYSILLIAAVGGAVWAATAQEHQTRFGAVMFVVGRVGVTVLVGGLLSIWISKATGFDWRWIIGLVGGFVAAVGPGYLVDQAKGWVNRRTGKEVQQ